MPRFTYMLSRTLQPVSRRDKIWEMPLATDRILFAGGGDGDARSAVVNYKDYFRAARLFLERNNCAVLTRAAAGRLKRAVLPEDIGDVRICLEKHGQFYHPSRIDVGGREFNLLFVLNVALSATGKAWLRTEYDTIKKLNLDFGNRYLPQVYAFGAVRLKRQGESIPMFLGEWFEGFNEFHLSRDPKTGRPQIVVWDYKRGDFFLTPEQAIDLFRQAARILTFYYNPQTFEQIFSWHHAAGDFVLELEKDRMNVRLIAARQYRTLFQLSKGHGPKETLELKALLIFFLQLCVRMRLDRLDGTGPIVWLGREALIGTLQGFFEALAQKPPLPALSIPISDGFRAYLGILTETDLLELLQDIAATYSAASPDTETVKAHLAGHAAELYQALQSGGM